MNEVDDEFRATSLATCAIQTNVTGVNTGVARYNSTAVSTASSWYRACYPACPVSNTVSTADIQYSPFLTIENKYNQQRRMKKNEYRGGSHCGWTVLIYYLIPMIIICRRTVLLLLLLLIGVPWSLTQVCCVVTKCINTLSSNRYRPESGNSGNSTIRIDVPIICTRRRRCTAVDGTNGTEREYRLTQHERRSVERWKLERVWTIGDESGRRTRLRFSAAATIARAQQSARYTIMGTTILLFVPTSMALWQMVMVIGNVLCSVRVACV